MLLSPTIQYTIYSYITYYVPQEFKTVEKANIFANKLYLEPHRNAFKLIEKYIKLTQLDNSLIVFSVNKYRVELVSESVNWKDLVAIRNFINEKGSVRARGEKHEF